MSVRAFIGLGSNLGNREAHCTAAATHLRRLPGTVLTRTSPLIETQPEDDVEGGPFLNGVAEIATTLPPDELLVGLQAIETALGRPSPHARGKARTIDLDLLLYGDAVVQRPGLTVPHPRLAARRFVLEPLAAIAPEVRHPVLDLTAVELLERLGVDRS